MSGIKIKLWALLWWSILITAAVVVVALSFLGIVPFKMLSIAAMIMSCIVTMGTSEIWYPKSNIENIAVILPIVGGILGGANIIGHLLKFAASLAEQFTL